MGQSLKANISGPCLISEYLNHSLFKLFIGLTIAACAD